MIYNIICVINKKLSGREAARCYVIEYFYKSLKVTQSHTFE